MKLVVDFLRDESGATAIEYGVIVAVVGTGLLTTLQSLNGSVVTFYDRFIASVVGAVD
ncbi:MAG: Flp family type IVb pilin [Hyphomicrobium sp.]|jgi:Flp pilus assembly pilin Flp|nr:Flp family type IVb pilin [Hyphomicrobium sp.]